MLDLETEDPEEQERNCALDVSQAELGEWTFNQIADFVTIVDVAYDGNCGYNAVIGALKYVKKCCRENVKEFRRDIRNYVENHKGENMFSVVTKSDLNTIFQEKLTHTGRVGKNHWMDGGYVGVAVANMFTVVVYIYSEKKKKENKKEKGKGKRELVREVGLKGKKWMKIVIRVKMERRK